MKSLVVVASMFLCSFAVAGNPGVRVDAPGVHVQTVAPQAVVQYAPQATQQVFSQRVEVPFSTNVPVEFNIPIDISAVMGVQAQAQASPCVACVPQVQSRIQTVQAPCNCVAQVTTQGSQVCVDCVPQVEAMGAEPALADGEPRRCGLLRKLFRRDR